VYSTVQSYSSVTCPLTVAALLCRGTVPFVFHPQSHGLPPTASFYSYLARFMQHDFIHVVGTRCAYSYLLLSLCLVACVNTLVSMRVNTRVHTGEETVGTR